MKTNARMKGMVMNLYFKCLECGNTRYFSTSIDRVGNVFWVCEKCGARADKNIFFDRAPIDRVLSPGNFLYMFTEQ